MTETARPGTIAWIDLTVDDAVRIRDFYSAVAGWTSEAVELDGTVVDGPRPMSGQRFCVIRDPAGAVAGYIGA